MSCAISFSPNRRAACGRMGGGGDGAKLLRRLYVTEVGMREKVNFNGLHRLGENNSKFLKVTNV